MPALDNGLYPALPDAPTTGAATSSAVLLTGVHGLNLDRPDAGRPAAAEHGHRSDRPVGTGNRLGVLAGEFAGFPNGRRLEDDVTDIELRAFACGYGDVLAGGARALQPDARTTCSATASTRTRAVLDDVPLPGAPHQGYDHGHHGS